MRLAEIGEFNLIERIRRVFETAGSEVLGIGDDCAVWDLDRDHVQLATTDLLIENRHFLRQAISPRDLGHKSLAVNLSDIAAMGGTPTAAFLSIGLPGDLEVAWWDDCFDGIRALSESSGCPLLGGDTTRSHGDIVINFAVLGTAEKSRVKYRSGAKPGDVIAVTGCLGDSAGGLRLLLDNDPLEMDDHRALVNVHHRPVPHLKEGRWLAGHPEVHAMLDVSDGVDSDIRHVMKASSVGAEIDLDRLPVSDRLGRTAAQMGWAVEELAVAGGEDYVLLCTVAASAFDRLANGFQEEFNRPLYAIGTMTGSHQRSYRRGGNVTALKSAGFDHFGAP